MALLRELRGCKVILNAGSVANLITQFQVKLTLEEEIIKSQLENHVLRNLVEEVKYNRWTDYMFRSDGVLLKKEDYTS